MRRDAVAGRPPAAAEFDSRRVAPPVQVDLWEKATARFLVPMRIQATGRSIVGVISARQVDQGSVCQLSATPHAAVRDKELASGAGGGHYKIAMGLHGRPVVSQQGRRTVLGPGDLTVYDTSEEYSVSGGAPFGLLVALVPYDALDVGRDRVAAVAATGLRGGHLGVLRAGLRALASGSRPDGGLDRVMAAARGAVRAAPPARMSGPRDAAALLDRAKEVISERVGDPGLSPGHVAAVLGVSRRYLYDLFAVGVGPIAGYIRTLRLERARDLLTTRPAELTVTEVALECGFSDPAHFSRLFRQAYGVSPLRFRRDWTVPAEP